MCISIRMYTTKELRLYTGIRHALPDMLFAWDGYAIPKQHRTSSMRTDYVNYNMQLHDDC